MNAPDAKPITPVVFPTVTTLVELRRLHSDLLQRQENRERQVRLSPGEMLGFLETARQLGRSLEDFEQREIAQGIMDYWTVKLLSQMPQAAENVRSFYLDEFISPAALRTAIPVPEKFELESAAKEMASKGPVLSPGKPPSEAAIPLKRPETGEELLPLKDAEEQKCLRKLLLRLFRLKEQSTEVYLVPLAEADPIFQSKDAKDVLKKLQKAGLVVTLAAGEDGPKYQLASPRLPYDWVALKKVVNQRRSFRELARGWDRGGRQPAALLTGGVGLSNAEDYVDLDDMEKEFLKTSLRHKETSRRDKAIVWTVLAMLFATILMFKNAQLKSTNNELAAQKKTVEENVEKLKAANDELETRRKELEDTNLKLVAEKEKSDKANAEAKQANEQLTQANNQLKQTIEQLRRTNEEFIIVLDQLKVAIDSGNDLLHAQQTSTNAVLDAHDYQMRQEKIKKAGDSLNQVQNAVKEKFPVRYYKKE